MLTLLQNCLFHTWSIIAESGLWLLLGLILGGIIHVFLPLSFVDRQLSKPGLGSVLKASLFGLPLPLCSCSVIPVAVSLRRAGASKGATTGFLISTPEIGFDSFALSWGLLGLPITILRTIAAFVSSLVAGLLVDKTTGTETLSSEEANKEKDSCCKKTSKNPVPTRSPIARALHFGLVELPQDLGPLLILGFLFAGLASSLIPPEFFQNSNLSPTLMCFLALLASLPVYVCATSMTPIAAVFLAKGVPIGAVLVFLLAGPASNIATMLAVKRELGSKSLLSYLFGVGAVALLTGFIANGLPLDTLTTNSLATAKPHQHLSSLDSVFGALLLILILLPQIQRLLKKGSNSTP